MTSPFNGILPGTAVTQRQTTLGRLRFSGEVARARTRLEHSRTAYREGRLLDALDLAVDLVESRPRANERQQSDDQEFALIHGGQLVIAALAMAQFGDMENADEFFRSAASTLGGNRQLALDFPDHAADLGIALSHTNAHEQAIPVLRRALELGESTPEVRRSLGISLAAVGREAEAFDVLCDAIRRAPLDWLTQWSFARLAEATGHSGPEVAAAWRAAGDGLRSRYRMDEALDAYLKADQRGPSAAVKASAAEILSELGRHDEALRTVEAALAEDSDHYEACTVWLYIMLTLDRASEALPRAERLVTQHPGDARAHTLHGLVLLAARQPERAVDALRQAEAADPDDPFIGERFAAALTSSGRPTEARAVLDRVLEHNPTDVAALEQRGLVLAILDENEASAADMRRATELDPGLALAWSVLGEQEFLLGNRETAVDALDRALALDPASAYLWSLRGDVLAALNQWMRARDSYREALAREPELVPALRGLAVALLTVDPVDLDEAERVARRVVRLAPGDGYCREVLGDTLLRLDRPEEALAELTEAARLVPDYFLAQLQRGRALVRLARLAEATEAFTTALALRPDSVETHVELGMAYADLAWIDGEDRAARLASAAEHLGEAVRHAPDNLDALLRLGQVHGERGELDQAHAALTRVLDADKAAGRPPDPILIADLGRVALLKGEPKAALDAADEALELDPNHTNAQFTKGEAEYALGRYTDAARTFAEVARREPEAADALSALGEAQRLLGNLEAALASLTRSYELNPRDPATLTSLAAVHRERAEFDVALRLLQEAIELDPSYLFALVQQRNLLLDRGETASAIDIMSRAAHDQPGNVRVQVEFAETLRLVGQYQEALAVLNDALWTAPDDTIALRAMGRTLLALGRNSDAVASFQRAVDADPRDSDAALDLADAQARAGLAAEALATVRTAAEVAPTAWAFGQQSWLLSGMGMFAEAVEAGQRAAELEPANIFGYKPLAWALQHLDPPRTVEALQAYERGLALNDADWWLRKGRAEARYELRDEEAAKTDFEWVVSSPTSQAAEGGLHTVGWCLYRLGRHQEAAAVYAKALLSSIDRTELLFDMGLNAWATGDRGNGRERYDEAIAQVRRQDSAGMRGAVLVAIRDLRLALDHAQLSLADEAEAMVARLRELLDQLPQPPTAALTGILTTPSG